MGILLARSIRFQVARTAKCVNCGPTLVSLTAVGLKWGEKVISEVYLWLVFHRSPVLAGSPPWGALRQGASVLIRGLVNNGDISRLGARLCGPHG